LDKLNFLHIGKTGGSTIKESLIEFEGTKTKFGEIIFTGHHGTLQPINNNIFFLRNPVDRYVSAYLSGYRQGLPRYNVPWTPAEKYYFGKFPTPNDLAEALFVDKEAHQAIMNLRHVNRPFISYIGNHENIQKCKDNILYIGIMETLEDDFENICKLIGVDASITTDEIKSHKTPNKYNDMKYLSSKSIDNIRRLYDVDYKIFKTLLDMGKISNEKYKKITK